jgi:branched-subunit amino acid ABC-type transport system permease component
MDVLLAIVSQFGLFGLLTVGVAVVFAASRIVNLAQADFAMVGAYGTAAVTSIPFGGRVLLAVVLSLPVLVAVERLLLRRIVAEGLAAMLVTWGLGMALRQGAELIFSSTSRSVAAPLPGTVHVLGTPYPTYRLVASLVAIAVVIGVLVVAYRSGWGLTLRAVADNPEMAALLGYDPRRLRLVAFAVGGALAVLGGALYSPVLAVNPSMGFSLLVPVFFGLLLSRPGALATAAVASLALATLLVLLRTYFSDSLAQALFYAVIIGGAALRTRPWTRRFMTWSRRILAPARTS